MLVKGQHYRTVWLCDDDPTAVNVIDQRLLPFQFVVLQLRTAKQAENAIKNMTVRGAGCIGATAGYGMYLAVLDASNAALEPARAILHVQQAGIDMKQTRPTATNLAWAVDRQMNAIKSAAPATMEEMIIVARQMADIIANEDAEWCKSIGLNGLEIIKEIYKKNGEKTVNILTHCNAGWLAFVDNGSATAPIYAAHQNGIPVHVWVDETRPRCQGSRLTAWELRENGIPHTIIADNVGGHLMQHALVDLVLVGSDRTTCTGDVANKIGTYLKALAAKDNGVPFYVALPSSTIDWEMNDGVKEIPIEQRDGDELEFVSGLDKNGEIVAVKVLPEGCNVANYGFDVTPARFVTALITERGVCNASRESISALFPGKKK